MLFMKGVGSGGCSLGMYLFYDVHGKFLWVWGGESMQKRTAKRLEVEPVQSID